MSGSGTLATIACKRPGAERCVVLAPEPQKVFWRVQTVVVQVTQLIPLNGRQSREADREAGAKRIPVAGFNRTVEIQVEERKRCAAVAGELNNRRNGVVVAGHQI